MGRVEKTSQSVVGNARETDSLFLTDKTGRQLFISVKDFFASNPVKSEITKIGSNFGSTYFVAPEGDDPTGKVGNIDKPFKTISAARDQAVIDGLSTSLIYVFPGIYDETELQYENGSLYLSAGAQIKPSAKINGSAGTATNTAVNQGTKTFTFVGNWAANLTPTRKMRVRGGANDGSYTIVSATDVGPNVEVVVEESIPSSSTGGYLNTNEAIFLIGWTPLNAPVTSISTNFKVFGEGTIDVVKSLDNDWSNSMIDVGANSTFYGEGVDWIQEQGIIVYVQNNGKVTLNVSTLAIYGAGGYCATVRDSSDTSFNVDRISSSGSWAFFVRQGADATFTGQCVIKANRITQGASFQPLAVQNMSAGRVLINCPIVESENYSLNFNAISGGQILFDGNIIAKGAGGNGLIGQNMSGGEIIINGNIEVETGRAITTLGGMTGGEIYINGDIKITSGNNVDAITITGTNNILRLNGRVTNTNGGALCTGIQKNGGNLVLDTVTIISDSDSIDASAAQNIIVNHSLAANKALDANVTNVVTGSSVIIDTNVK